MRLTRPREGGRGRGETTNIVNIGKLNASFLKVKRNPIIKVNQRAAFYSAPIREAEKEIGIKVINLILIPDMYMLLNEKKNPHTCCFPNGH